MRRGRSRVGVERLEPTSSRIILHLRRLSVAVLAEGGVGSTACPSPHGSAQFDLTACDRRGTRRVGRAWRGGVGLSSGAPEWPRRAQRARHPLPAAGRVPLRGGAQQCQLNRTACNRYGTQRVGRAVRDGAGRLCWAIACGGGPPPRASNSCTGCTRAWSCDATHGTVARACWSRRATGATLHRP